MGIAVKMLPRLRGHLKMRHTMAAIPFLLAIGALPALAVQLPAYCGGVGATSYTPPAVTIPTVVLNRGTVITVTNATMAVNGDTSSVAALVANPGADGISLPEAIMATNNDPGTWVIQFAPALKGSTIDIEQFGMPGLTGGNVTINGDIDGDGQPDITLTTSQSGGTVGFSVYSGGNTLYALALQNFMYGVWISPPRLALPAPAATYSNTTIGNLVLTGIQFTGIGVNPPSPTSANDQGTWDHVLITGNTISSNVAGRVLGIDLELGSTAGGDTLQHTIVANNTIVLPGSTGGGIAMNAGGGIGSTNNQALDTLIANNTISAGAPEFGIRIGEGLGSASANLIDGVQIIGNRISITRTILTPADTFPTVTGINLAGGDGASDDANPNLLPIQYSKNNIARNIGILSNTIEGTANIGIFAQVACCGNSDNVIDSLSILGNTMTGVYGDGVMLVAGTQSPSIPTTGNALSNVLVEANSIQVTSLIYDGCNCYPAGMGISFGGIQVWAGLQEPGNRVNGISIANNDVDTPLVGIGIVGGVGGGGAPPPSPADNNVVADAQISCNQVDRAPTLGLDYPGVKGIDVTSGLLDATGNQVLRVRVENNLIAGALSDAAFFANLGDGASGNSISISRVAAPVSCDPLTPPMLPKNGQCGRRPL